MPDVGSDEHRAQLLLDIFRTTHGCWGKRSRFTFLCLLHDLSLKQPGTITLSNRMEVVMYLKQKPEIWQQIIPYLDPNCSAARIYNCNG